MSNRSIRQVEAIQQARIRAIRRGDVQPYRYPIVHEVAHKMHAVDGDYAFAAGPLWPSMPANTRSEWCPEQIEG